MKKKYLFQTIGSILLFGCVVLGCGKSNEENLVESIQELSWFCDLPWWDPQNWNIDFETGTGKITEKTGVQIRYMIPEDNGDTRLSLMLINGNMSDIFSVSNEQMIRHLIQSDAVWNLEELFKEYLPESHLLNDYPEDLKNLLIERDGGWYGLVGDMHSVDNQENYGEISEFYQEFREKKQNLGIIWNKVLLKRLGYTVEDLQTEKQILDVFQVVKEHEITVNTEKVIPVLVDGINYSSTTLQFLGDTFGANCITEDGSYCSWITTKQGYHALEFLNKLFRLGYADHQQTIMKVYNVKRTLNSGQVLCFIGDIENCGINPDEWISSGAIFSEYGDTPRVGVDQGISIGKVTTFVSKNCKNPLAAARFLDIMTTSEGMQNYLNSGENWWPIRNDDWYYSVLSDKNEKMNAWKELLCTYFDEEEVEIYDKTALTYTADVGKMSDIQAAVRESFDQGVNIVLWAESETEFDSAYNELMKNMQEAGLSILEADRTKKMK